MGFMSYLHISRELKTSILRKTHPNINQIKHQNTIYFLLIFLSKYSKIKIKDMDVAKPLEERKYLAYLKLVGWNLNKGGFDYSLCDENGNYLLYDQDYSWKRKKT